MHDGDACTGDHASTRTDRPFHQVFQITDFCLNILIMRKKYLIKPFRGEKLKLILIREKKN